MKLLPRKLRLWWLCRRIGISTADFSAWRDALYSESLEVGHIPPSIFGPLASMRVSGFERADMIEWLRAAQSHPISSGVNLVHAIRAIEATDEVVARFDGKLAAKHKLAAELIDSHLSPDVASMILEARP